MLINLREMLQIAEKKHSAIGSFNVYNVESLQAVMNASAKASAPVIVSFGESYDSHMPLEGMAELVKLYAAASEVPIVLHLDHSKKMTTILRALKAGFTSIMYDGSAFPLAENIERSRRPCPECQPGGRTRLHEPGGRHPIQHGRSGKLYAGR